VKPRIDLAKGRIGFPDTFGVYVYAPAEVVRLAIDAFEALNAVELVNVAPVKAPVVPENADGDQETDAILSSEQHLQHMKTQAHVDASATGQVPADFVPTSAMNGRPSSGMKTDSAMVKRI
jgi:hypothetical protein